MLTRDERLAAVEWRDLLRLTPTEVFREVVIVLPWLTLTLGAWYVAEHLHMAFGVLAVAAAFMLFLTGLRQVHGGFHYSLGLSRPTTELVMYALSVVMLSSMHAIQVTHLHHHRHCLDEQDVEGALAKTPWWKALLLGPYFTVSIHWHGYRLASAKRKQRILIDFALLIAWGVLVFGVFDVFALKAHFLTMAVAQNWTGFFAVWTVHHGCDGSEVIARTQRGWLKNLISYDMFLHVEHHLCPAVPQPHLHVLSKRLDEAAPDLKDLLVY
jgi:fatty acid desaturase